MFFRLRYLFRFCVPVFRCGLSLLGLLGCFSLRALEVAYAPEAVFVGEPLTFRLESPVAGQGMVHTNGLQAAVFPLASGAPAEVTLFPLSSMELRFSVPGEDNVDFRVIRPGEKRRLRERDGFLEVEDVPAILLPDHRKPPPLDRRWETAEIVRKHLIESRRALDTVLWITPPDSPLPGLVQPLLSAQAPLRPGAGPSTWFRVHEALLAPQLPRSSFLVVEIDDHDLERGMPPHVLFLKWQFVLQHLQGQCGYGDGLLFGPVSSRPAAKIADPILEQFQSLALAHGLRYIDRSLPESVWRERLVHQLQREYKLP